MNYNIAKPLEPSRNFAARFSPPYTIYIVGPRKPEDAPYMADLDFGKYPLVYFVAENNPGNGDILEVFTLDRRVQLIGLRIEVVAVAPVILQPVTNSGISFPVFDCTAPKDTTFVLPPEQALVIDDPDYLGLQILDGAEFLNELFIRVQLVVSDTFSHKTPTNSVKKDGR